jgi:hypothetical protein
MPAVLQEGLHCPGELPGVAAGPAAVGEGNSGEQDLVLGLEPGQRLPVVGGRLGDGAGAGRGESDEVTYRMQQQGGLACGVQVVVEDPADSCLALGLAVGVAGLGVGVGAEQVVEGIPARDMLGD